jgi:hypothetical protein
MRTTLIAMCVVLCVSLVLCFYSMRVQMTALDALDDMRASVLEAVHAGDVQKAEEELVVLANSFREYAQTLELLTSHDDIHDAYSHLVDVRISLECEDLDDAYQALAQLGEALGHLREHEEFTLANLT